MSCQTKEKTYYQLQKEIQIICDRKGKRKTGYSEENKQLNDNKRNFSQQK